MPPTIAAVVAGTLLWTGALVWLLAAVYGLSSGAMWCLDKTLRSLGLWPAIYAVMRRYYHERHGERDGN